LPDSRRWDVTPRGLTLRSDFGLRTTELTLSGLHGLGELPRDDLLDCLGLSFLENTLLFEELVNAGTKMFFSHCHNSFWEVSMPFGGLDGGVGERLFSLIVQPLQGLGNGGFKGIQFLFND